MPSRDKCQPREFYSFESFPFSEWLFCLVCPQDSLCFGFQVVWRLWVNSLFGGLGGVWNFLNWRLHLLPFRWVLDWPTWMVSTYLRRLVFPALFPNSNPNKCSLLPHFFPILYLSLIKVEFSRANFAVRCTMVRSFISTPPIDVSWPLCSEQTIQAIENFNHQGVSKLILIRSFYWLSISEFYPNPFIFKWKLNNPSTTYRHPPIEGLNLFKHQKKTPKNHI